MRARTVRKEADGEGMDSTGTTQKKLKVTVKGVDKGQIIRGDEGEVDKEGGRWTMRVIE